VSEELVTPECRISTRTDSRGYDELRVATRKTVGGGDGPSIGDPFEGFEGGAGTTRRSSPDLAADLAGRVPYRMEVDVVLSGFATIASTGSESVTVPETWIGPSSACSAGPAGVSENARRNATTPAVSRRDAGPWMCAWVTFSTFFPVIR